MVRGARLPAQRGQAAQGPEALVPGILQTLAATYPGSSPLPQSLDIPDGATLYGYLAFASGPNRDGAAMLAAHIAATDPATWTRAYIELTDSSSHTDMRIAIQEPKLLIKPPDDPDWLPNVRLVE